MVAVWCNEGPLYKSEDDQIYSLTINNSIIDRYLEYVDNIYMLTRVRKMEDKKDKYSKINITEKFKVVEMENCSSIKGIIFNSKKVKKEILKYLKLADICFIGMPSILGNIAITCCKEINKEYILEVLACPFDSLWNYGNLKGKLMAPVQYAITKKKVAEAQNVVYVSNEFLQKRYPNKFNNVGCSDVIIESISQDVVNNRLNRINSYNKDYTYKIGLIGSLNLGYKGHDTAIKSISLLKDKYNVELHFLGKGSKEIWENYIKRYNVESNVYFDGTLPAGQPVLEWMDNIDIFLIPSLQEGLPRSLVEAMSRACPTIGVKTGGIPELISKEFIADKKDYKKIAQMIESMILSKDVMSNQAKINHKKSVEFEKKKINDIRNNFYKGVINNENK